MSYYFNTEIFLGYEFGKEIEDLVTSGEVLMNILRMFLRMVI